MAMEDGTGAGSGAKAYCWTFGNAEFDEARWQLRVAGQDVDLEHKPLEVLQYLLRHAGEAVTKDELLAAAWAGRVVVEAVLTNAIGKLRRALADEAQDLIVTLPRVGYRLAVPVSRNRVDFIPATGRLATGDAVPRRPNWRLEEALARTDGNEVWLARQTKTRESRVFKFSLAGKGLGGLKREVTVARLLREALGDREDFVRVLDWDFEQAPYFIESEYGGVSLDRWPASGGLAAISRERRLALFVQAAEAVGVAHGVGILHKDLKPANLLIHGEGDEARMRVADFGSSRLFESGVLDELGITRLGLTQTQAISGDSGTPLYLAPEVVAGQTATIKSDVYALGVTLYQLLVGDFRRPLAPGWEHDVDDPLLRQDIADAANGDPARRLDSAASLADRIRNLLSRREKRVLEQAVQARIAEGEKRLARLHARRPWVIATAVLLFAGLGATGWQLKRSVAAERMAAQQRDRAQKQAARAEAVVRYLSDDLIQSITPQGKGFEKNPTIREMVEYAAQNLESNFRDDPATRASLHAAIGSTWASLSDPDQSAAHYRKAWQGYSKAFGPTDELSVLTRYELAQQLVAAGDFEQAEAALSAADHDAGTRRVEDTRIGLAASYARGMYHYGQYQVDEAKPFLERADALRMRVAPHNEILGASIRLTLADMYQRQGNFEEVIAMMRKSLTDPEIKSEELKNRFRHQLAKLLMFQRKYEQALPLAELTAASTISMHGAESRKALMRQSQLATLYSASGDCKRALALRNNLWETGLRRYGLVDQDVLHIGSSLAQDQYKCGDKNVGVDLKKQVLGGKLKRFGSDYAEVHSDRFFLAGMLKKEGEYQEALDILEQVNPKMLATATSSPAAEHWINIERGGLMISLGNEKRGRQVIADAIDGALKMGIAPDSKRLVDARKLLGS